MQTLTWDVDAAARNSDAYSLTSAMQARQKPTRYPHSNSLLFEISSQEQLSPEQMSDHPPKIWKLVLTSTVGSHIGHIIFPAHRHGHGTEIQKHLLKNLEFRKNLENLHPCMPNHYTQRKCSIISVQLQVSFNSPIQSKTQPTVPSPPQHRTLKFGTSLKNFNL